MPLGRHHHGLLLIQGDHVEALALHREPDEAEVRGTVTQDGSWAPSSDIKECSGTSGTRSSQRRIHLPGVTPAT